MPGQSDANWNKKFDSLCLYKTKYGNTLVPKKYPEDQSLSYWVYNQRSKMKNGILSQERIQKLESIGFVWRAKEDPTFREQFRERKMNPALWEHRYQELIQFKKKEGK